MRFRLLLAISLILVCATSATSHHSFAGVYDESRLVTVSGVVTQFKFVNPHALMYMDVTDPSGKVAKWTIEFAGRRRARVTAVGRTASAAGDPSSGTRRVVEGGDVGLSMSAPPGVRRGTSGRGGRR